MTDSRTVLFVDDEAPILSSLKRLLRREPYAVLTADSGQAGLETLRQHPVQVVVTDQRMPGTSGVEFLQQVKAQWPDTVRLVLSGYADADTIVEAINQGEVYRFINKPWNDDALRHTIGQAFAHWDMVMENRRLNELSSRQLAELRRLNALLEGSVEARTRSLEFSQEMLECLPQIVLGISAEGELMLTSGRARSELPPLRDIIPGVVIDDVLPPRAVEGVHDCLENRRQATFRFDWDGRPLRAQPALLGPADALRGCVLVLEDEGGEP